MTQEEAEKDKRKNLLTRSIGTQPSVEVDTYQWPIRNGDQLLISTDGLLNMVNDETRQQILTLDRTAQEKVDILIEKALENGGKDNVTIILAVVNPPKSKLRKQRRNAWFRKHSANIRRKIVLFFYSLLLITLGYIAGYVHARFLSLF